MFWFIKKCEQICVFLAAHSSYKVSAMDCVDTQTVFMEPLKQIVQEELLLPWHFLWPVQ